METVFDIVFVVGVIAIPLLYYWLSIKKAGPDQGQKRNEKEKAKRETQPR